MKKYNITVNGKKYEVEVEEASGSAEHIQPAAPVIQSPAPVKTEPAVNTAAAAPAKDMQQKVQTPVSQGSEGNIKVTSPMPGTILKVNVVPGDNVKKGDVLCVLEAMKMENDIVSPDDGSVSGVSVTKGSSVNAGDLLVSLN